MTGAVEVAGAVTADEPPAYPHLIAIEWPPKGRPVALPGWGISITDTVTGEPITKTSGGSPGVQAGEESGVARSVADGLRS